MEEAYGEHTGINHVKIGRIEVPTDSKARIWIHFTDFVPERYIPAWEVFEEDFDASRAEGHILLVGTSAAGLKDLRATPLNPAAAGVEVHALAIEQMLLGHYLERPDWGDGAEITYMVVLGVTLTLLLPLLGALWCAFLGAAAAAAAVALSWYSYTEFQQLLDPVYPSLVVLAVYLAGSLINFLRSEAERRQVRGAFSRYMSPALVEQLAEDPSRLVLGGEMRNMTLLFADIRGFTTISEQFKADPQGLTRLINRFLTPMTDKILERRGTIDKYMGDAIMAFWNAPLDDEGHATHACDSALEMFNALEGLNADIKAAREAAGEPFFPLNIGIGLNSGECCVGNMGSDQRFDYSVLGDPVNLAAARGPVQELRRRRRHRHRRDHQNRHSRVRDDRARLHRRQGQDRGRAHLRTARRKGHEGEPAVPAARGAPQCHARGLSRSRVQPGRDPGQGVPAVGRSAQHPLRPLRGAACGLRSRAAAARLGRRLRRYLEVARQVTGPGEGREARGFVASPNMAILRHTL